MIVTLDEAKKHLRADPSGDDDTLITLYIEAAEDYIRNYLNAEIPGDEHSPPEYPAAIKAAALLLIGGMYENRESHGEKDIKENPAVTSLLHPYREGLGV